MFLGVQVYDMKGVSLGYVKSFQCSLAESNAYFSHPSHDDAALWSRLGLSQRLGRRRVGSPRSRCGQIATSR